MVIAAAHGEVPADRTAVHTSSVAPRRGHYSATPPNVPQLKSVVVARGEHPPRRGQVVGKDGLVGNATVPLECGLWIARAEVPKNRCAVPRARENL